MIKANPKVFFLQNFFSQPFKPFFFFGSLYAVFAVTIWLLVYQLGYSPDGLNPVSWHSYEMIFGYTFAVIAGFLLTAIENWTGVKPASTKSIFILFVLWAAARVLRMPFIMAPSFAFIFDWSFQGFLLVHASIPIMQTNARQHWAVLGKILIIFLIFPGIVYAEIFSLSELSSNLQKICLLSIIALILTMIRRLLPFFISKAMKGSVKNYDVIDRISLVLFLAYIIAFIVSPRFSALIAFALFGVHLTRVFYWYTNFIWTSSLLWSFYLGYLFITFGFLLHGLTSIIAINPFLYLHAFAYGGLGLITQSVMLRAALGHSGQSVLAPPRMAQIVFIFLSVGLIFRVIFPIIFPQSYLTWIGLSMTLWIVSFGILSFILIRIFTIPEQKKASFKILHN